MRATSRVTGQVAEATVLTPPGRYGDGPVRIRVDKELAGEWRPPARYPVEVNDWRCALDPRFDYIEVENTHNAFLYVEAMVEGRVGRSVPAEVLSVVRLAHRGARR